MKYLFTYGTLMSGQCRNEILLCFGAQCLGEASISGIKLYDYNNSFPVALLDNEGGITGEIYAIEDSMWEQLLPILDQIESRGYMYNLYRVPFEKDKELHIYLGIEEFWKDCPLKEIAGEAPKWGE